MREHGERRLTRWLRSRLPGRLRWRLTALTVLLLAVALVGVGFLQYLALRGYLLERSLADVASQVDASPLRAAVAGGSGQLPPSEAFTVYDESEHRFVRPLADGKPRVELPHWAIHLEPARAQNMVDERRTLELANSVTGKGAVPTGKGASAHETPLPGWEQVALSLLKDVAYWAQLSRGGLPAGDEVFREPQGKYDVLVTIWPLSPSSATYLLVETRISDVDTLLQADIVIFSVTAALVLLLTAVLAIWLTSRTLSPLEAVTAVARAIRAGSYDRRTGIRGPSEVAVLAAAFDEMLDHLQEQIRREQESEARMRRFLADASHELRTPVTTILGNLEVLRRGASASRADLEESLAAMHVMSVRMASLIRDLLALARFEQAEVRLRADPVDVGELLDAAVRAARGSTREHVVLTDPPPAGAAVVGDREALERILVNLLDNAAKYSPAGGRISVGAREVASGEVELLVSDEGPGVAVGERERIFERLYRGDRARVARAGEGAGLGLAICRALARRQGGDVTVREARGGGATFAVRVPGRAAGGPGR